MSKQSTSKRRGKQSGLRVVDADEAAARCYSNDPEIVAAARSVRNAVLGAITTFATNSDNEPGSAESVALLEILRHLAYLDEQIAETLKDIEALTAGRAS